jgi:hypothetical protein
VAHAPEAYDYSTYDFLQFGGPIVDCPQLHDLAAVVAPHGGHQLPAKWPCASSTSSTTSSPTRKGITNAASPITDILTTGYGVCQDFTHLMIALARLLKIPATLRLAASFTPTPSAIAATPRPTPGAKCSSPPPGWVGFDPANRCVIGGNFVKVAVGRDFRDVPPNRGVYRGNATETIDVAVKSDELAGHPVGVSRRADAVFGCPRVSPPGPRRCSELADLAEVQQQQQQQQQ